MWVKTQSSYCRKKHTKAPQLKNQVGQVMISPLGEQDMATKAWKGSWRCNSAGVIVNEQTAVTCAEHTSPWQAQGPELSKHKPVGPQKHKV